MTIQNSKAMKNNQPAYELDDGDLTDAQIKLVRDYVLRIDPTMSSFKSIRSSLFEQKPTDKPS